VQLGVGPWYVLRGITQSGLYRGEPCTVTLTIGFANSGDLQLEVIHQDDDTHRSIRSSPTPGCDGYQPAGLLGGELRRRAGAGRRRAGLWCGPVATRTRARYGLLRAPDRTGAITELMELTPATVGMAELVRSAAAGWTAATRSGC